MNVLRSALRPPRLAARLLLCLLVGLGLVGLAEPTPARTAGLAHRVVLPVTVRGIAMGAPPLRLGANVLNKFNTEHLSAMEFRWAKLRVSWSVAEPARGSYNFVNARNSIDGARTGYSGAQILILIEDVPEWARTDDPNQPFDRAAFTQFMGRLAETFRGQVQAYELFNEMNLEYEWARTTRAGWPGDRSLVSTSYARMLQQVYPTVKAADPSALIVTAGVSPAGDGGAGSVGDVSWIEGLYRAGAAASFDIIGTHPYGGPFGYDQPASEATAAWGGIHFRRAEEHYAVAVRHGDPNRQLWATEFGWVVDPDAYGYGHCQPYLGSRWDWRRSPGDVAAQTAGAVRYAMEKWPWMTGMFLFNLDASSMAAGTDEWYVPCATENWYAAVSAGPSRLPGRPTYEPLMDALRNVARANIRP